MRQYLDLMQQILDEGVEQMDRTGTGTISRFGGQMRFDLATGFPLLTTKKLHLRSIIVELLWFLRGDTNTAWLKDRKVSIWDEWADENGDLGPVYGKQWRDWEAADGRHIDQISELVSLIKRDPASRRQIVTAWNPGEIHRMALAPCHCLFQTQVAAGRLNLQLYQRSADFFLGVPFNIASYALLTHMLARECGLEPGTFVWTGGDVGVRIVGFELEILRLVAVDRLPAVLEHQPRQRPRLAAQLQPRLLEMVGVEVAIAAGPHEHAGLQPALPRQHMGQQRIAGDIERHSDEEIRAALVELEVEPAVGRLGLEQAVAGRQRHPLDLARVPGGDDLAAR